jgi:hypothetical protein
MAEIIIQIDVKAYYLPTVIKEINVLSADKQMK